MTRRAATHLALVLVLAAALGGCAGDSATPAASDPPTPTASVPPVTLPPGALSDLVLAPDEVPTGMIPLLKGSGPRSIGVVAGYSGSGAAQASAQSRLASHGFSGAYVAQYVNPANGQVLSVLASQFRTASGAEADLADDLRAAQGRAVPTPTIGEQSGVTVQPLAEKPAAELVIVRFRRGATTWSLAYKATPPADATVAVDLARKLLARTAA